MSAKEPVARMTAIRPRSHLARQRGESAKATRATSFGSINFEVIFKNRGLKKAVFGQQKPAFPLST
jgi:hypothetical protein